MKDSKLQDHNIIDSRADKHSILYHDEMQQKCLHNNTYCFQFILKQNFNF